MHDIVIIGAGPAGLTAAVYARRAGKTAAVLEKSSFGGQITHSPKVENYPGFTEISGAELADRMTEQALFQGAEIELETVTGIEKRAEGFCVVTEDSEYPCKSVIIAAGADPRRLGVAREEELAGNGIYYCAVCDGAFQKGRTVGIVGGGNSALQEALLLADIVSRLYVIQNLDFFTGEEKMVEALRARNNVEILLGTVVEELIGKDGLQAVRVRNGAGMDRQIELEALFVAIGRVPDNEAYADVAALDKSGYIDADESCTTRTPGIFVAGDCRSKVVRQLATAISDGAAAALAACRYIDAL